MLELINQPNDIKSIMPEDYDLLASEIREFLIDRVSKNGGHLASNLGAVELTMALHLTLDLPKDKLIWDVGHQAYTHKLLTGRRDAFESLRKEGGLSGFPKRSESDCDCFNTGHSSTSISAGLGFVKARELSKEDYCVVSVIGDGSMTGGLAYEALNNAAQLDTNFIIVLNDNNMSISENVGGMSKYLNNIRTADKYLGLKEGIYNSLRKTKHGDVMVETIRRAKSSVKQLVVPGMFFEDMGITYLGPIDGHNVKAVCRALREAKRCKNAVLVHVITEKGRGYEPARRYPDRFHGTEPFDIETGKVCNPAKKLSYTQVFSSAICQLAGRDERIVAISAAMADGTGLKQFAKRFPERFVDVGIAEEHAVTYAAALAADGYRPVVAIYSSFLQRAYDQILHDVCMQNLHVVFMLDRAGIVGSDGETHQGVFDLSYLGSAPNMTILTPKNKWECADMLRYALEMEGPVAIRYPRGEAFDGLEELRTPIAEKRSEVIRTGSEVAILAAGSMVRNALEACDLLEKKGIRATLINARYVKPIDEDCIDLLMEEHRLILTLEENVLRGGYGEAVLSYVNRKNPKFFQSGRVMTLGIPDRFIAQGKRDDLLAGLGLDAESIADTVMRAME